MDLRRSLPWVAAAGLAGLAAYGPIGTSTADASPEGARETVRRLTAALEAGGLSQLIASYACDADHRDLARGDRVRGRSAIGAFLAETYGPDVGGGVEVVSLRLLTTDVAIAQLNVRWAGGPWPPYLTVLLRRRGEDPWRPIATRAGGNPDTRERGLRGHLVDPFR